MTVKTSGAEFKRFYIDNSPTFWPDGAYHDDTVIVVDGQEATSDVDLSIIPDQALVVIMGGVVIMPGNREPVSFELHFKRWRKAQTIRTLVVEVGVDKLDAVVRVIKAAGGYVLGG